jgi:hypothetical protein
MSFSRQLFGLTARKHGGSCPRSTLPLENERVFSYRGVMASYASPTSRSGRRLGVRSRPRWGFVRDVVRWLLRRRAKIPSQLLSKLAVMDRTPHRRRPAAPATAVALAGFVRRRRARLAGSPRARVRARVMRWTSRPRFNWPLASRTLFACGPFLGRSENFGKQRKPWERSRLLLYLPKKFNQKSRSSVANPLNQLRTKKTTYPRQQMTYLNATSRGSFSLRKSLFLYLCTDFPCSHGVHDLSVSVSTSSPFMHASVKALAQNISAGAAARRSRPCSGARPLLRIGDPSLYAPSPALPSVDPAVLRSYPLSCYKPKHSPGALVAIGTSLAGAQTTPPKTHLSSPNHKKLQKPPICRPFTRIPAAQNIPTLRKARFATSPRAGQCPAQNQKKHPQPPPPKRKPPPTQPQTASPRRTMTLGEPSEGR